jgi:glycosyltransferase involved in cell wall biosynthesis
MTAFKNLHILVLSSWYPNVTAPASGIFIQRFAQWMSHYFKISVIFIKSRPNIVETYFEENKSDNFHEIIGYYPTPSGAFKRFKQIALYKKTLDEAIKKLDSNPDLIHAHVSFPKGKEFEYVSKKLKVDYIIHEHSSDFSDFEQKRWTKLKRNLIVSTLRKAKLVVAVSPFLEKQILKVEPHLVHTVLPLPVDLELFFPEKRNLKKDHYTFIHVSGLDEKFKNVKGIVEAFSRVRKNYGHVELKIVTDGDAEYLQKFIDENQMHDGVEILENLSHAAVAQAYRESDCFVLFSEFETYSCVLIEALSSGLQIITTQVGIAHDLDDRIIQIVPRQDVHALATTMENRILTAPTESNRRALTDIAKRFAQNEVLGQLKNIYSNVLQRYDLE